jgi:hypothetical protein
VDGSACGAGEVAGTEADTTDAGGVDGGGATNVGGAARGAALRSAANVGAAGAVVNLRMTAPGTRARAKPSIAPEAPAFQLRSRSTAPLVRRDVLRVVANAPTSQLGSMVDTEAPFPSFGPEHFVCHAGNAVFHGFFRLASRDGFSIPWSADYVRRDQGAEVGYIADVQTVVSAPCADRGELA